MGQVGYQALGSTGVGSLKCTSGDRVIRKPVGVTLDWGTFTAVSGADVTLKDGLIIPIGQKYGRYGQVLCRITRLGVITFTVTGTLTAGSFSYVLTRPDTGVTVTVTVPYDSSVAAHQALVNTAFGSGVLTVGGSTLPGGPQTLTATSLGAFSGYALTAPTIDNSGLTGGTVAAALTFAGSTTGKYGPYDPAASDGRQTMTNGECGILESTITEKGPISLLPIQASDLVGLIIGGDVFKRRLIATSGTHSLAAGPTYTELLAVFPQLNFVNDLV